MLKITVGATESFDEGKNEFTKVGGVVLELEHSLVSLSKWESKWEKPFLHTSVMTDEMALSYLEMMILTPDFPPDIALRFSKDENDVVAEYLGAKMTATWINEREDAKSNKEIITAEIIYHWMIEYQIPYDARHWHLNQLLTLIRVRDAKLSPKKKMTRAEIFARNREINERNKKLFESKG